MTPLQLAKSRLLIPELWQMRGWPGKPGKSCKFPDGADKKPSASIFRDGVLLRDFRSCKTYNGLGLLAEVEGMTREAACRLFIELAGVSRDDVAAARYAPPARREPSGNARHSGATHKASPAAFGAGNRGRFARTFKAPGREPRSRPARHRARAAVVCRFDARQLPRVDPHGSLAMERNLPPSRRQTVATTAFQAKSAHVARRLGELASWFARGRRVSRARPGGRLARLARGFSFRNRASPRGTPHARLHGRRGPSHPG